MSYKPSRLEMRVACSEFGLRSPISPFVWGASESLCDEARSLTHPITWQELGGLRRSGCPTAGHGPWGRLPLSFCMSHLVGMKQLVSTGWMAPAWCTGPRRRRESLALICWHVRVKSWWGGGHQEEIRLCMVGQPVHVNSVLQCVYCPLKPQCSQATTKIILKSILCLLLLWGLSVPSLSVCLSLQSLSS